MSVKIAESSNKVIIDEYVDLGLKESQMGHYRKALECFDSALELSPECHDIWLYKGGALVALACYDEALQCFVQAIGLSET